jgi:hypothetical protein
MVASSTLLHRFSIPLENLVPEILHVIGIAEDVLLPMVRNEVTVKN